MNDPYRAQLHRFILFFAAGYNILFGLWTGLWPNSFFELFELDLPRYPAIWQCLGMVVGLYGLAYGYAALHLDRAKPFVLIGLLGKILGPIGWCITVGDGDWPPRTITLILFNDLAWWLPFTLILLEGSRPAPWIRASAPWVCAAINVFGAFVLAIFLAPGTEAESDPDKRRTWVEGHLQLWRIGWAIWIVADITLLAFYAWWGRRISSATWVVTAFGVAVAGLCIDFLSLSLIIGWIPDRMESIMKTSGVLSGGIANGLFCVAGALLTIGDKTLPWWLKTWSWAIWGVGFALTVASLVDHAVGKIVTTAIMFSIFCPWVAFMGWKAK